MVNYSKTNSRTFLGQNSENGKFQHISKNKCICFNDLLKLMAMKMSLKMKNKLQRYHIHWPRSTYRPKYSKYYMCLSIMIVACIKQLTNVWSWTHEKVKQYWHWVEKSVACQKRCNVISHFCEVVIMTIGRQDYCHVLCFNWNTFSTRATTLW